MSFWKWLERIFPFILQALMDLADSGVDGAELNQRDKHLVVLGYAALTTLGEEIVKDTETTIDDNTVKALLTWCHDTSEEGGFSLNAKDYEN